MSVKSRCVDEESLSVLLLPNNLVWEQLELKTCCRWSWSWSWCRIGGFKVKCPKQIWPILDFQKPGSNQPVWKLSPAHLAASVTPSRPLTGRTVKCDVTGRKNFGKVGAEQPDFSFLCAVKRARQRNWNRFKCALNVSLATQRGCNKMRGRRTEWERRRVNEAEERGPVCQRLLVLPQVVKTQKKKEKKIGSPH